MNEITGNAEEGNLLVISGIIRNQLEIKMDNNVVAQSE